MNIADVLLLSSYVKSGRTVIGFRWRGTCAFSVFDKNFEDDPLYVSSKAKILSLAQSVAIATEGKDLFVSCLMYRLDALYVFMIANVATYEQKMDWIKSIWMLVEVEAIHVNDELNGIHIVQPA